MSNGAKECWEDCEWEHLVLGPWSSVCIRAFSFFFSPEMWPVDGLSHLHRLLKALLCLEARHLLLVTLWTALPRFSGWRRVLTKSCAEANFPYVIHIPEPCEPWQTVSLVIWWTTERHTRTAKAPRGGAGGGGGEGGGGAGGGQRAMLSRMLSDWNSPHTRSDRPNGTQSPLTRSSQTKGGFGGPSFLLGLVTSLLPWTAIVHSWVILAHPVSISSSWSTALTSDRYEGPAWRNKR